MPTLYYEDFSIGQVFETPARTITEADIVNFAGVSGDFYSLHTDEIFASKTIFGGRVAHGLLTISIVTGLWMRLGIFEGSLIAFYGIDRLRFVKPVKIGDTIRARLTVIDKRLKDNHGLVTIKNEVYNQKNELVAVFEAILMISRKGQQ
ncbi:bifunctional aldehyde dehydrogenase/enoyl-CoA hydratase [Desulfurococcaceae archaeon AG1]|jgi:acyl dehydratase|nr:bifunctional aldehyde dehydrogenase/enoyl-CoA hydratase [Desulfurococcaceae archaeon AG1]